MPTDESYFSRAADRLLSTEIWEAGRLPGVLESTSIPPTRNARLVGLDLLESAVAEWKRRFYANGKEK
jgi:hypothetical protein